MIAGLDLVSRLPRISCPTSVLVDEFDLSSPVAADRQLHKLIAGFETQVIVGPRLWIPSGPLQRDAHGKLLRRDSRHSFDVSDAV